MGTKSERREKRIAAAQARDAALKLGGGVGTLSHFQRVIKALTIVSPIILALRYEDGLNHCIEASICAAEALTRRQITARVVPCFAVAAHRRKQNLIIPVGLSPREMYDQINWGTSSKLPYETWKAQNANQVPDDKLNVHVVIEASLGDERALIDLTIGQLREAPTAEARTIPWQVIMHGPGWPGFESPDWTISYGDTLHSSEVLAPVNRMLKNYENRYFIDDLHDAIELVLRYDLDEARFRAEVKRQQPTEFETAMTRIAQFGGV